MIDVGFDQVAAPGMKMKWSNPLHARSAGDEGEGKADFSSLLTKSLSEVNDKQIQYSDLIQKSLTDPDSVNPHDITIAGAEANLALNITKNVLDRVVQAYKEISTLR